MIGSSSSPQFGVWTHLVDAELLRRGLPSFEQFVVDQCTHADLVECLTSVVPAAIA